VPEILADKIVVALDLGAMVAAHASEVNLRNASRIRLRRSRIPTVK
jgi:hypothetical protein